MKTVILLLICIACGLVLCCSSETDPLPTDTWSQGCIELAPHQGNNKLYGLCCASISFPKLRLDKNRAFSVEGTYSTFNGAGTINFPLKVNGQLSADASTLTLSYSINAVLTTHTLKPRKAIVSCDCSCD